MTVAATATADSGLDSPESGVVQMGRGSAWTARADDPLAAYFNPAAMAFQATSVHLGAQLMMSKKCFTRVGTNGQPVAPDTSVPAPLLAGQPQPAGTMAVLPSDTVCSPPTPFPNPQLGAVFRVHDKVAVGFALVAPHAAGSTNFPESLSYTNAFGFPLTQPSPQRYLLVSSNALIINPTISVAYAPLENLSFGIGFVWGIGTVDFTTFSESVSPVPMAGMTPTDHSGNDVKAELKAKDLFIPGIVASVLWMPTNNFDVSGWFKWQDALQANTNLTLTSGYWKPNGAQWATYCTDNMHPTGCNITQANDAGTIKFQIPMEAKLAFRYHHPRADISDQPGWANVPGRKVRDPLSQDVFDIEVDFTYANNSAVQDIQLAFHPGIVIQDGSPSGVGSVPTNGNIAHNWRDVGGVRLGGDFNVIPNVLALRTGGWFETAGQDPAYLNVDFDMAMKGGVAGGATVRLGPVDVSIGYQHTFYATMNNNGNGLVHALSGDRSGLSPGSGGSPALCGPNATTNPAIGPGCFRSFQAVNGGSLTQFINEVGLSGTAHF
jgi:long-chain fatty acid transport protein